MNKVVLTRFFCQELLFDYLQGRLTPERAADVEEFLQGDEVCREDLEHLKRAIGYCETLATIDTPLEWVERWQNLPPALAKRLSDWEMKLVGKAWNALPYAVVVLVMGLGLWIFKPWKSFSNRELVVWTAPPINHEEVKTAAVDAPTPAPVVEVKKKEELAKPVPPPTTDAPNALTQLPPKEVPSNLAVSDKNKIHEGLVAAAMPSTTPTPAEPKPPEPLKVAVVTPPPPKKPEPEVTEENEAPAVRETAPPKAAAADVHEASVTEEAEEDMVPDKSKTANARGLVYRATMSVEEFDKNSALIKEKILALGGEKARKAELGWHRKRTESYFHFTLPESNHDPLVHFLSTLGPVRISKDKHPVVMPAGKIRIILVVKESANHGGEQETE